MIIEKKDILGFEVGNKQIHTDCATETEIAEFTADDIYLVGEIDKNEMVFCDRCGKLLW